MPDKHERFVSAYLRLNGYFQVQNFIVHAGDDPGRISRGDVGNYTECDTLGIRLPYSHESIGPKEVVNHAQLIDGGGARTDVVIAEVKSGTDNRPNRAWKSGIADPVISYIVRFIGTHDEDEVKLVSESLAKSYRFEDARTRYRYVVFAGDVNDDYRNKGVTYITFREAARFIVEVRGQSWIDAAIGQRSIHQQWDEMLLEIFQIANAHDRDIEQRITDIEACLRA